MEVHTPVSEILHLPLEVDAIFNQNPPAWPILHGCSLRLGRLSYAQGCPQQNFHQI